MFYLLYHIAYGHHICLGGDILQQGPIHKFAYLAMSGPCEVT